MASSTARILNCLEMLQDHPTATGPELADRLQVHPRTVRRYIAVLQDLGIPIAAARGTGGGYRLRPGYRLPPLMLGPDEAVIVVLGLLAAHDAGIDTAEPAAQRALAKVRRVLPDALRRQVEALATVTSSTAIKRAAVAPAVTLLDLADAIGRRRRITCRYVRHDGTVSDRELSPFGLVAHADRWYLAAHDHGRQALRTFRVDRIDDPHVAGNAVRPPEGFDASEHVRDALADVPWRWTIRADLKLSHADAVARLPPTLATLEPIDDAHTAMRIRAEHLDYAARVLAGLGCGFIVHEPDELRTHLHTLASQLTRAADA